jgi:hypothetical protein
MSKPDLAIAARIVRLSTEWQGATARFLSLIEAYDRERGPDRNILALHDSALNSAYREWTTASLALSLTCVFQYGWWTADFPHRVNPHLVRYVSSVGTSHDLEMLRTCIATMREMADRAAAEAQCDLRESEAAGVAEEPESPAPVVRMATTPSSNRAAGDGKPVKPLDLVTLNQAAAIVCHKKRSLEKYGKRLPTPHVKGGSGKAHLYDWDVMRPWLEAEYHVSLPARYPANRRDP